MIKNATLERFYRSYTPTYTYYFTPIYTYYSKNVKIYLYSITCTTCTSFTTLRSTFVYIVY